MEATQTAKQSVRALVARINRAWRESDFSDLGECFAEDAVMVGPGNAVLGRGRASFVQSYREFATAAIVLDYVESEPIVEVFDAVAICAYTWTMTFRRESGSETQSGYDQFVLSRSNEQWCVVWRQVRFDEP